MSTKPLEGGKLRIETVCYLLSMAIQVVELSSGGYKITLNLEIWVNGEVSKSANI